MDLAEGPEAAAEIAEALAATPPLGRVVASPARRCRGLAEALAARDGVALELDDRLWEMDFGVWEGMSWDAIRRADSDPWAADPWTVAPPGGETFAAVHARVGAVLAGAVPGTALVCHAGPIRAARMILTGASFAAVVAEPVPYAAPLRFAGAG
jgi:alpha-ribazole phosphatase